VRVDIKADGAELKNYVQGATVTSKQWKRPVMAITDARRQELLGTAPGAPISDTAVKHTVQFVVRVLNSWPRMMASRQAGQFPPIIHPVQFAEKMPTLLSNCSVLAKMWLEHDGGSSELVQHTVLQEVRKLLCEVSHLDSNSIQESSKSITQHEMTDINNSIPRMMKSIYLLPRSHS
jgi:hypothetical protein